MKICDLLKESHVVFDLQAGEKAEVLNHFVSELKNRGLLQTETDILAELMKRENLGSTGLANGIAIPHALIDELNEPFLGLALINKGTDFQAVDQ
jgi:PTS system nitrogen regulatory IIA component